MREQNLHFEVARDFFIEMKLSNSELFEKNVHILDFAILDIDLALNRYCLWSCDYSPHVLNHAVVFFGKRFCY